MGDAGESVRPVFGFFRTKEKGAHIDYIALLGLFLMFGCLETPEDPCDVQSLMDGTNLAMNCRLEFFFILLVGLSTAQFLVPAEHYGIPSNATDIYVIDSGVFPLENDLQI